MRNNTTTTATTATIPPRLIQQPQQRSRRSNASPKYACCLARIHLQSGALLTRDRCNIQKFVEASSELMNIIEEVNEVEDSSREKKLSKEVSQSRSLSLSLVGVMSIHSYLVGC